MDVRLDRWLPQPQVRVAHAHLSSADPERLFSSASSLRMTEAALLGRLIRWRIPGTPGGATFEELFRSPPFIVLEERQSELLICGLVGRIWTLRRDYPRLADPEEFAQWSRKGTARVLFAHWVEPAADGGAVIHSEARVRAFGRQGALGLAAVRPLVRAFHSLIVSDGMAAAARRAEDARHQV